ncbi:MAG: zinc ribbon domain-containing protein [Lachnospiraceae bacterium]|nr:zinc ribbon domain-containing protein [Lachnospiraceae bacterium]
MGAKAEGRKTYQVPLSYFSGKLKAIHLTGLGMSVKSENPTATGVWYRILHGITAKSYGEKITVTLTPVAGGTDVHIHSECGLPTQIMDLGQNKQNVANIFAYLENGMPVPGSVQSTVQTPVYTAAPAAQTPAPAAAPAPASGIRYCANCGAANQAASKFCYQCGKPMR